MRPDKAVPMSVDAVLSWLRGIPSPLENFHIELVPDQSMVWRAGERKEDTHSGKMWEIRGAWQCGIPRVPREQ